MSLVVLNNTTRKRLEYASLDHVAYQLLNGKQEVRKMRHMKEIMYMNCSDMDSTYDKSHRFEVFGKIENIEVVALKQTKGIPKLDCTGILPADMTLLRTFQSVCGITTSDESIDMGTQRFVMKPKWYRFFIGEKRIEITPESIRKYLTPGTKIDIEYHMNYVRQIGTSTNRLSGDPLIRKIIIHSTE